MKYIINTEYKLFFPRVCSERIKQYLAKQRNSDHLHSQEFIIEYFEDFFTKFEHYRLDELKSHLFSNYSGLDLKNMANFSELNCKESYYFEDEESAKNWKSEQELLFSSQIEAIESIFSIKIGEVTTRYGGRYYFYVNLPRLNNFIG